MADQPGQTTMDTQTTPQPNPQDPAQAERRLAALGWSEDAAKAYAAFHAGIRWPRPSDF